MLAAVRVASRLLRTREKGCCYCTVLLCPNPANISLSAGSSSLKDFLSEEKKEHRADKFIMPIIDACISE